jgi:uncharacterized membrane protein
MLTPITPSSMLPAAAMATVTIVTPSPLAESMVDKITTDVRHSAVNLNGAVIALCGLAVFSLSQDDSQNEWNLLSSNNRNYYFISASYIGLTWMLVLGLVMVTIILAMISSSSSSILNDKWRKMISSSSPRIPIMMKLANSEFMTSGSLNSSTTHGGERCRNENKLDMV